MAEVLVTGMWGSEVGLSGAGPVRLERRRGGALWGTDEMREGPAKLSKRTEATDALAVVGWLADHWLRVPFLIEVIDSDLDTVQEEVAVNMALNYSIDIDITWALPEDLHEGTVEALCRQPQLARLRACMMEPDSAGGKWFRTGLRWEDDGAGAEVSEFLVDANLNSG